MSQNSYQETHFNKAFGLAVRWITNVYLSNNFAFTKFVIRARISVFGIPNGDHKWVIIGRGCLVALKFKSSLCWRMLCFKALKRLCSFGINLPCVNPTFLHADSQWIIILKTFELVTANSMLNIIDSLPMPYISLISTWDCYAVFEAWCD